MKTLAENHADMRKSEPLLAAVRDFIEAVDARREAYDHDVDRWTAARAAYDAALERLRELAR